MQAPLLLLLVPSVLGYLDVTVFQVDTRDENSQGLVNPYALAQILCTVGVVPLSSLFPLSARLSKPLDVCFERRGLGSTTECHLLHVPRSYRGKTSLIPINSPFQQQVMALFENGALVVNDYLAANQEVYVGNYIDTFNLLVTGQRNAVRSSSPGL